MPVRSLGYIHWNTPAADAWNSFASSVLGLMATSGPDDGGSYFRIDEYPYRLAFHPAETAGPGAVGFEVTDDIELEELARAICDAGIDVVEGSDAETASRLVSGLIRFVDPSGIPLEVFYGPVLDHVPLRTLDGVSFVTGDLGMGHLVVGSDDFARADAFYRHTLGFRLRNTLFVTRDGQRRKTYFLGCNPRHHTLGVVDLPIPGHVVHLMFQVAGIDDVGRALDRCVDAGIPITMSLGRHTNDRMVSFYCQGPDTMRVEYGCDGLRVEDGETTRTYEITKSSFWGHRPPRP
jgi:3,4-dihydroxy-9,10-secoandrosta-1,3,5(10)-triene-9,17-dione 4,5-dioxygenase